jgi:ribosomal protein S26
MLLKEINGTIITWFIPIERCTLHMHYHMTTNVHTKIVKVKKKR